MSHFECYTTWRIRFTFSGDVFAENRAKNVRDDYVINSAPGNVVTRYGPNVVQIIRKQFYEERPWL